MNVFIFDIDGVIRDVSGSYRRALADTVEHFVLHLTGDRYRPSSEDIDDLKAEGTWNNDWEASQELILRYLKGRSLTVSYEEIVAFFQGRYRGKRSDWTDGYIASEPLIANKEYFVNLTASGVGWGFFSGATRASAGYVLGRLEIADPVLVAMEDAPGKPDPTGLLVAVRQIAAMGKDEIEQVVYVGDTVADMLTVVKARDYEPNYQYVAVGVIPPHVRDRDRYADLLRANGADLVLNNVLELETSFQSRNG